jgi:hypothetical protein
VSGDVCVCLGERAREGWRERDRVNEGGIEEKMWKVAKEGGRERERERESERARGREGGREVGR